MAIRVLIVDDHIVVRQGLRMFLELDAGIEIVGEAANGAEAIELAQATQPDVVIMDLLMPVMSGIEATSVIRRELPETEVLALTSVLEDLAVIEALRAGAIGYMLKDTDAPQLRRAIQAAADGKVQLSPQVTAQLMRDVHAPGSPETLTDREREVLSLLAHGHANKDIARLLQIGETTVKTHVRNILAKLNVASRTQAAIYAIRAGLAPTSELGDTP